MAMNYVRGQAVDENGNPVYNGAIPVPALKQWTIENGVTSSVVNLNPNTTILEVGAVGGQGVAIKWIPATDTTSASVVSSGLTQANFDNWVPANIVRQFVVPRETIGNGLVSQKGSVYGLYQRVAWINKGATPSSIIANEY